MKKIAIIMPYFNEAELLSNSVNAVLNQSYTNWHLYLIDDGSEKGKRAFEILNIPDNFKNKITYVYKSNGGVSSARNQALNMVLNDSSYDYIAYCDSDDVWVKDYLKQQINTFVDCDIFTIGCDMVYATPEHRFIDGSKAIPYGIAEYPDFPGARTLIDKGNCIFISGVVHKVEITNKIGFFDWQLNSIEDWDYWVRVAQAGYKIIKNPNTTFVYTVKDNGNGSKSNKEVYERFYQKHSWFK